MLKSVMNVLMVPVLGFALLIAVSHADVIPLDLPVKHCLLDTPCDHNCINHAGWCGNAPTYSSCHSSCACYSVGSGPNTGNYCYDPNP